MINVVNKHHGHVADGISKIYIGRGSSLGNPYSHMAGTKAEFVVATREDAITAYETWLREQIRLNNKAVCSALNYIGWRELQGEDTDLVCFCEPQPCHGRIVKKIIWEHLTTKHPVIDRFDGEFRFLSNFWTLGFVIQLADDPTVNYPTTEHAYQAAKTLDLSHRRDVLHLTAGQAKRFGRKVVLRPDWEEVKVDIMLHLLRQKFHRRGALAQYLDQTGDAMLIEGNHWGDVFWGMCKGVGENHLGRLLMKIRAQNRS